MRTKSLVALLGVMVFMNGMAFADDEIALIPQPVELDRLDGQFIISADFSIVVDEKSPRLRDLAGFLAEPLRRLTGYKIPVVAHSEHDGSAALTITSSSADGLPPEGYSLRIAPGSIVLRANDPAGQFYGLQTLLQLLPPEVMAPQPLPGTQIELPALKIRDFPRFGYRGMHLDVSRHFFPVEFVKRYIDLIAMHKMNRFHWHLTDDNGWRIEIQRYPELTSISAWRVDREHEPWRSWTPAEPGEEATYGGFYTQEEIKEVVRYAQQRFITIVPEIEMPGHSSEVFAAYPHLSCTGERLQVASGGVWPNYEIFCAGNEEVFTFLENVLSEVIELFPGSYIHIGGDEAHKMRWESCPKCQARMEAEGLADEGELQSWFIKRIEKFLISKGRRLLGWDEILEGGLAPEATVMSWRGMKGGIEAARMGHDVIMTPVSHCYFDYYQAQPATQPEAIGGYTTLKKVYSFEPVPPELSDEQSRHVLGAQGNLWTEWIPTPEHAEYMAMPRMSALAEVVWSPAGQRHWPDFNRRLQTHFQRLEAMGVNYCPGDYAVSIDGQVFADGGLRIAMESEIYQADIRYALGGPLPTADSPVYQEPLALRGSTTVTAAVFEKGDLQGIPTSVTFHVNDATGKPVSGGLPYSSRYAAGGKQALTDGLWGSTDHNDGRWQGYSGEDMEAVVDLGREVQDKEISVRFLQKTGAWIMLPASISISVSRDGQEFTPAARWEPKPSEHAGTVISQFSQRTSGEPFRYVKIEAEALTSLPDWHEGAGEEAWFFVDEILVR